MNLISLLEDSSAKFSRRLAIIFSSRKLTYKTLNIKVNQLSRALSNKLQISREDKVAILLNNSPEYIISLFAIVKMAGISVPLNTFLTAVELKYILNDSQTKALITSSDFLPLLEELKEGCRSLREIILVDKKLDGYIYLSDFIKEEYANNPTRTINQNSTALLIYTSGTTGRPKGVMLTHRNLFSNIKACQEVLKIGPRDRLFLLLPMFHSFTMLVCILLPLYAGARIVVVKSVRPFMKVIKTILLNRVTILVGIPHLFRVLKEIKLPWILLKLLSIKLCISGAAPLKEGTLRDFLQNFKLPVCKC